MSTVKVAIHGDEAGIARVVAVFERAGIASQAVRRPSFDDSTDVYLVISSVPEEELVAVMEDVRPLLPSTGITRIVVGDTSIDRPQANSIDRLLA